MNSTDEREVFRKYLKGFNHIELADVSDQSLDNSLRGGRWMENACHKGIKCDILVMSGHFAGTFFGSTDLRLPAETLEKMSCDPGCDGILKNPKEVFLFGCNTLAGKAVDSRTPEQYRQVLMEDGFSVLEAQQIAALRYSPVGSSFYDRMSRIFSESPKIYGFNAKGPSGKNVRPLLENYFKRIPDYSTHISKITKEGTNLAWTQALAVTSRAQTSGRAAKINYCPIYDTKVTFLEKLKLVKSLMDDKKNLIEQVPVIAKFVEVESSNKTRVFSKEEAQVMQSIRANAETREVLNRFLTSESQGMLRVQLSMLNISRYFGFWPAEYCEKIQTKLIGDLTKPANQERFEAIHFLQVTLPGLRLENLPSEEWNEWDIRIVGLLKPSDIRIAQKLSQYLTVGGARSDIAMQSLLQLGIYDAGIIRRVVQFGAPVLSNLAGARNNENLDVLVEYLNRGPRSTDTEMFYSQLLSALMREKDAPGFFFAPLEYYSTHNVRSPIALEVALKAWASGQGGRSGWYSYHYLTSMPPCKQLPELRAAEDNLRKNRRQWSAYNDSSFDESMGATPHITGNFAEVEVYPRIYNLCK
jgi:hypothetical protein